MRDRLCPWLIVFIFFSIDRVKGFIELSLRGADVGGPDPAQNEKEGRVQRKRKKDVNANDESHDEGEQVLKKLRTGVTNLCRCILTLALHRIVPMTRNICPLSGRPRSFKHHFER